MIFELIINQIQILKNETKQSKPYKFHKRQTKTDRKKNNLAKAEKGYWGKNHLNSHKGKGTLISEGILNLDSSSKNHSLPTSHLFLRMGPNLKYLSILSHLNLET